jgi:hypothetical protein
MRLVYEVLDWFFLVFHAALVLFNVLGWALPSTRRLHLVTMGLTAASWLLVGAWKGIGYCVCTDWHWRIREALGYRAEPGTYIQFLVHRLTGIVPDFNLTRWGSGLVFVLAAVLSIGLNLRDRKIRLSHISDMRPTV